MVKDGPSIRQKFPEGGCAAPCSARLSCGHSWDPRHDQTSIKAGKCVARSGLIVLTNTSASCPASKTVAPVQAVLPVCGHSQEVRCGEDLSLVVCRDMCDKTRECGHKCML